MPAPTVQGAKDPRTQGPAVGSNEAHSVSTNLLVNSTRAMYRALGQATGGGALQPAESTADARRIALDGQASTWPQYVEAYGDDAQQCWDDAYDRSFPRRIALDGQAYTWAQYVEAYGDDARRCWGDAYDREVAAEKFG